MADTKISQLTAASTPLAGTEVVPLVQSSTTKKVSVANLTAGRAVTMAQLDVDNVRIDGNTVSSTDTNGNVNLAPNGYGEVIIPNSADPDAKLVLSGYGAGGDPYVRGYDRLGALNFNLVCDSDVNSRAFTYYGNVVMGTAAKGVNFTANTPAAGMTSQLLNWYEEGTWTPADASGAGLSFTGLSGNCYYTRVGNVVTLIFNITYPTTTNISSTSVSGLPFTSKNTTNSVAGGHLSYTNAGKEISCIVVNNATSFSMYDNAGNTIKNNELSGKIIRGSLVYLV